MGCGTVFTIASVSDGRGRCDDAAIDFANVTGFRCIVWTQHNDITNEY